MWKLYMHLNGYMTFDSHFSVPDYQKYMLSPGIVLLSIKIWPPSYFLCPLNDLTILLFCPIFLFIFLSRFHFRWKIPALFSLRDNVLSICNFQIFFFNFSNIFPNTYCSICSVSCISLPSLVMHIHAQITLIFFFIFFFFFMFKLSFFFS